MFCPRRSEGSFPRQSSCKLWWITNILLLSTRFEKPLGSMKEGWQGQWLTAQTQTKETELMPPHVSTLYVRGVTAIIWIMKLEIVQIVQQTSISPSHCNAWKFECSFCHAVKGMVRKSPLVTSGSWTAGVCVSARNRDPNRNNLRSSEVWRMLYEFVIPR